MSSSGETAARVRGPAKLRRVSEAGKRMTARITTRGTQTQERRGRFRPRVEEMRGWSSACASVTFGRGSLCRFAAN
jgi:hypothetical protein